MFILLALPAREANKITIKIQFYLKRNVYIPFTIMLFRAHFKYTWAFAESMTHFINIYLVYLHMKRYNETSTHWVTKESKDKTNRPTVRHPREKQKKSPHLSSALLCKMALIWIYNIRTILCSIVCSAQCSTRDIKTLAVWTMKRTHQHNNNKIHRISFTI